MTQVLVFPPGTAVAFGRGLTVLLGLRVALDQDKEFLCRGCFLRPQLQPGGEFLEWTESGEEGRGFLAQRGQPGNPGRPAAFQLRQLLPQCGGAAAQAGETDFVGQPLVKHRTQRAQSAQRGPNGVAIAVRRPVPERDQLGVGEGHRAQFLRGYGHGGRRLFLSSPGSIDGLQLAAEDLGPPVQLKLPALDGDGGSGGLGLGPPAFGRCQPGLAAGPRRRGLAGGQAGGPLPV